ncbi:hypothetical protein P3X46_023152 [Hevea brasiliensis]|uniref:Retrotransposon Copia-like N-terminal domain-containing protein n=1 Tax=Hevea brasiliensis TaxID=3981 RepID=A0ABQ9LA09_HEVBR|nr:hypothetical protein P3X46_023152 [Hevea brasiliensis]
MTDSQNSSHSSDSVGTVTHACNPSEDISLPYYLHHSKDHSSVIVTPELTSNNFASWRRSFLLAISTRNKQGFLDGSILKPTPKDPLYLSWVQCNYLLMARCSGQFHLQLLLLCSTWRMQNKFGRN